MDLTRTLVTGHEETGNDFWYIRDNGDIANVIFHVGAGDAKFGP
ncbi:hypothetical protein BLA18109_01164 [Burkholderia lata]|uniref:Uncharacterized protein n=1 Tax=Burkholderia lata (strain ATCC 17760 / DSM 23089 / LMG 22485 / NCIMB 9086 / R18194 / 383) TaxID=482957 RepID=A0A6P2TLV9_BURL3|nr:hypothetical protein BLA18109_01164 [Burkholderia lata]